MPLNLNIMSKVKRLVQFIEFYLIFLRTALTHFEGLWLELEVSSFCCLLDYITPFTSVYKG